MSRHAARSLEGVNVRSCAILAVSVVLAGCGCKAKPPARSIDDEIAEALRHVDPIILYERVPIPDEENAFPLWVKAFEKLVEVEDKRLDAAFREAVVGDAPFPEGDLGRGLAEWLRTNEEALALVDEGIKRGRCQFPEVEGPGTEMPYLAHLRQVGRMKLLKAKLLASAGDFEAAGGELAEILRLGELAAGGEGTLINYLVGIAVQRIGTRGIRRLAEGRDIPAEVLERLIADLRPLPLHDGDLVQAFRVEFSCVVVPALRQMTDEIARTGGAAAETLQVAGGYHERGIRNVLGSWKSRDRTIERDAENQWEQRAREVWPHNAVERIPMGILLPAMNAPLELSLRIRADRAATRTVLALRLYELRHGALPAALQALVGDGILEAVPVDPFADEPLRYSRERRVVWSVGPNETDEGGVAKPGSWPEDDFVLPVPATRQ